MNIDLLTLGLGLATSGLSAIAAILNKKKRVSDAIVDAVIDGVERANDPKTKQAIKSASEVYGVGKDLYKRVKRRT